MTCPECDRPLDSHKMDCSRGRTTVLETISVSDETLDSMTHKVAAVLLEGVPELWLSLDDKYAINDMLQAFLQERRVRFYATDG